MELRFLYGITLIFSLITLIVSFSVLYSYLSDSTPELLIDMLSYFTFSLCTISMCIKGLTRINDDETSYLLGINGNTNDKTLVHVFIFLYYLMLGHIIVRIMYVGGRREYSYLSGVGILFVAIMFVLSILAFFE